MLYKAVIVDDEPHARSVLKSLLAKFCPTINVIGETDNIKDAYELILDKEPDVVFLDIQMPGGNGFNLLKKFKDFLFDVVFVTSYDQYAIEAIKLSALHYLLKPLEIEDLKEAVRRLDKDRASLSAKEKLIENAIYNSEAVEKKITVHTKDHVVFLSLNEICQFEADVNYTFIYTKDNKKFTAAKNIGEFENALKDHLNFFRIDKGCLVNINCVKDYSKGDPCIITLVNGHSYEVSRRRKQELVEMLKLKT